jgi:PilZ domain
MPKPTLLVQAEFSEGLSEAERRLAERYFLDRKPPTCLLTRPNLEYLNALLENVSVNGIQLLVDRPLEPGTVLALRLTSGRFSVIESAHVIYARPRPEGEWVIGCKLAAPLSGSELESLLEEGVKQVPAAP